MRMFTTIALGAALIAGSAAAHPPQGGAAAPQKAQPMQGMDHSNMPGMQGMDHSNMPGMMGMGNMSREQMTMHGGPAGPEFHTNMQRMNQNMMQQGMDTDPTRSWAKSMIAHHQGAIDNSRTVLKFTRDAEARRLATKTIQENLKGQAELRALLARQAGGARR